MKILCLVHGYPPVQNAGAEWMLHEMMKYMVEHGHGVQVLLPISQLKPYNFEGVKVEIDNFSYTKKAIADCDVIISHLDKAGRALNLAEYYHKPFIQIIHNSNLVDILNSKNRELSAGRFVYVIYNSEWLKKEMRYIVPGIVVHPPVDGKRYMTEKPKAIKIKGVNSVEVQTVKPKGIKKPNKITLINLFERKGSQFFYDIARLMPDYEFLGVEGGYGKQDKCNLPNVSYMENTPDAKYIYQSTRILLMPSKYESYGRTGVEAMSCGIPVIAAPTPGLKESLGDAGIYCSLDSPLKWIEAIKDLDNEKTYQAQSKKCLERSKELEIAIDGELENMNKWIDDIINKRV